MKSANLLVVLFTIVLLSISSGITTVHSQTQGCLYKDFGVTNQTDLAGTIAYSYDVQLTIVVNQPNAEWISGKTYEVDWLINLTYMNPNIFSNNSLSVLFSIPSNETYPDVVVHPIENQFQLTPQQHYASLVMNFTAGNTPMDFQFNVGIFTAIYDNGVVASFGNLHEWSQSMPIPVSIVNSSIPEFPSLAILTILMVVVSITVLVIVRKNSILNH